MKQTILLTTALLFSGLSIIAQAPRVLKKVSELKMPKTADDDKPGTRGACVAWDPVGKKYYASFAGNFEYPLAVFDASGKRQSDDEQTALIDVRGLWYDASTKKISGNAHADAGWFNYTLDKKGIPTEVTVTFEGQYQPDAQSVGAFDVAAKKIYFLLGGQVFSYNKKAELLDSVAIHWSRFKADGPADFEDPMVSPEDYNYTSLITTGVKGQEIGFLNTTNKEVEMYDIKTGYLVKRFAFPDNAPAEMSFNFAFANGIYWLFDMENRKWIGYK